MRQAGRSYFMRVVRNSLVLFAASVVLSGAVQAQDKAALLHRGDSPTNTTAHITWERTSEPTVAWGSGTRLTGLFVNLIKPQQTWAMLNPSVPARNLPTPVPPSLRPITAPRVSNDDPAVHAESDFALLRFSFH